MIRVARVATRIAVLVTAAALLTGLSACGKSPDLLPRTITGATPPGAVVLMPPETSDAMMASVKVFVVARKTQVTSAQGTPHDISASVTHGSWVDLVILPLGPDLDRLRDELVVAPMVIGKAGGTAYYAAPVTSRGLMFAQYLVSAPGQAVLHRHGLTA